MFRQPLLDRGWQQQQLVGLIRAEGFHVPQYPHPVSPRQRFDDYSDRLLASLAHLLAHPDTPRDPTRLLVRNWATRHLEGQLDLAVVVALVPDHVLKAEGAMVVVQVHRL